MSEPDLSLLTVRAEWNSEARVWVAESDDVPGLVTELDPIERLHRTLTELYDLNRVVGSDARVLRSSVRSPRVA